MGVRVGAQGRNNRHPEGLLGPELQALRRATAPVRAEPLQDLPRWQEEEKDERGHRAVPQDDIQANHDVRQHHQLTELR